MKPKLLIYGMLVLAVIIIILTSGCTREVSHEKLINANLDSSFQLKINETGFIETENIKIKFLNVTEDSRCPSDVVCVWEGQAKIEVNILKDDKNSGNFNLTKRAGNEDLAVKNFNGYSIKLVNVDPYPESTQEIEISDYVVTLLVSKTT